MFPIQRLALALIQQLAPKPQLLEKVEKLQARHQTQLIPRMTQLPLIPRRTHQRRKAEPTTVPMRQTLRLVQKQKEMLKGRERVKEKQKVMLKGKKRVKEKQKETQRQDLTRKEKAPLKEIREDYEARSRHHQ